MKKFIMFLGAVAIVTSGFAQKKNIQSASNSLKFKEYNEAVKYIEEAVKDPSTKDDAKAWFVRGSIYLAMDQDPGYAGKNYYNQVVESYKKVLELKPKYEPQAVASGLIYAAYKSYNASVKSYNSKQFDDAYAAAKQTVDIHDMDGGKLAEGNKGFDTVAAGAMIIQAYSAFYNNKPDVALPVLLKLKDNPIEGNANVYLIISDVYKKKGEFDKQLAIIEEAKTKYPKNPNIRNEELNYYIVTKQQDKLIQKLEDAVNSDPENAVYQYNLANAYTNLAFPKDATGKSGPKPENYDELISKAEKGFEKAVSLAPDNVGYHYDMGVLYFNQASQVTEQMNQVTGTSAEDDKKWKELETVRNGFFDKAFPHLEKVYQAYEPKVKSLNADDKFIYQSALAAMREIYARENKLDKAAEMKEKILESKK